MAASRSVQFKKYTLDSGMRLVIESHPHVRSTSIGVWVSAGSRNEILPNNGISHFLEHMVFKQTETRGPLEIPLAIESLGGDLNAFTDKEYTCYHATVLNEDLGVAVDVLADLVIRPTLPKLEIERERKVLLQELSMVEDTPDEWILSLLFNAVWKKHSLGLPIAGTRKTVNAITRSQLVAYFKNYYRPENMLVSVSGDVDFDRVKNLCEKHFRFPKVKRAFKTPKLDTVSFLSRRKVKQAETEQTHFMVAYEASGYSSQDRYAYLLLSYYLAGGMSSRLFQEIREKAALAYTVECDYIGYSDTALFSIYVAMANRSLKKCMAILKKEIQRLILEPIADADLDPFKGQLRGSFLLGADGMEFRQESIARSEILLGEYIPVETVIDRILAVTPKQIQDLASKTFTPDRESAIVLCRDKVLPSALKVL